MYKITPLVTDAPSQATGDKQVTGPKPHVGV